MRPFPLTVPQTVLSPRLLSLLVLAPWASSCFSPSAVGVPCSPTGACPPDLKCYESPPGPSRCYAQAPAIVRPSVCSSDAEFCEDFESTQEDFDKRWNTVHLSSTVTLDTTHVHRGKGALHVKILPPVPEPPNDIGQGEITESSVVPLPDFYIRFFAYFPGPFPRTEFRFAALTQAQEPYDGTSLYVHLGYFQAGGIDSVGSLATDQWVCIEWHVKVATEGEVQLWIDEQELTDNRILLDTSAITPPALATLGLALFTDQFPPFTSFDIWYDDVAIDGRRIGCQQTDDQPVLRPGP